MLLADIVLLTNVHFVLLSTNNVLIELSDWLHRPRGSLCVHQLFFFLFFGKESKMTITDLH